MEDVVDQLVATVRSAQRHVNVAMCSAHRYHTTESKRQAAEALLHIYKCISLQLSNVEGPDPDLLSGFTSQDRSSLTAHVKTLNAMVSTSEIRLQCILAVLGNSRYCGKDPIRRVPGLPALQSDASRIQDCIVLINASLALARRIDHPGAAFRNCHSLHRHSTHKLIAPCRGGPKKSTRIVVDFTSPEHISLTVDVSGHNFPKRISLDFRFSDDEEPPAAQGHASRTPLGHRERMDVPPPLLGPPAPHDAVTATEADRNEVEEPGAERTVVLKPRGRCGYLTDPLEPVADDEPDRVEGSLAVDGAARGPVECSIPVNGTPRVQTPSFSGGAAAATDAGHNDNEGIPAEAAVVLKQPKRRNRAAVAPGHMTDDKAASGEEPPVKDAAKLRPHRPRRHAIGASEARMDGSNAESDLSTSLSQCSAPRLPDATLRRFLVVVLFVLFSSAALCHPVGCLLILLCSVVLFLEKANTNAGNFVETP